MRLFAGCRITSLDLLVLFLFFVFFVFFVFLPPSGGLGMPPSSISGGIEAERGAEGRLGGGFGGAPIFGNISAIGVGGYLR